MSPGDFINHAIGTGEALGIEALDDIQRMIWLVAEAEAWCDMGTIDTFLDRYAARWLEDTRLAFEAFGATEIAECFALLPSAPDDEAELDRLCSLISSRRGYSFESIVREVGRRLTSGCS